MTELGASLAERQFDDLVPLPVLVAERAEAARILAGSLAVEPFAGFDPVAKDGFIDPE